MIVDFLVSSGGGLVTKKFGQTQWLLDDVINWIWLLRSYHAKVLSAKTIENGKWMATMAHRYSSLFLVFWLSD